jgi:hypothetical protein
MASTPARLGVDSLQRILCLVVLVLVLLAGLYAGWIGAINFSRIRV